ncbi:MAG TPA: GerMN domain-containing protein [Acidisarcina sp.]|nr:GerMN domain-containing protein [Acidisarcina sp.]
MIPRYQKIIFWVLLGAAILMSVVLIRLRERAHDRLLATADQMPLNAPAAAPAETVTMLVANDADGSLTPVDQQIALPEEAGARARILLQRLLAGYAEPQSTHHIGASGGAGEVFLMPVPRQKGEMAVVNLSGAFVDGHPSGIETETLTLLSIIGTLHTNFPQITQVRFLVDGQPRETLAGHADLTRVYLAEDKSVEVRR